MRAATMMRGLKARMTRVSFQPYTKPMTTPVRKEEVHWKQIPILSPMPIWILLTSLQSQVLLYKYGLHVSMNYSEDLILA